MNNITVTVQLSQDDRDTLDMIHHTLVNIAQDLVSIYASVATAHECNCKAPQPEKIEAVTEPTPAEEKPAEVITEPEPTVSRADIQSKVVNLAAAGKKAEVRAIVTEYAPKVSGIPEDKLAVVYNRLVALEV